MKPNWKWLLLAPALAVVLLLGPLRPTAPGTNPGMNPAPAANRPASAAPGADAPSGASAGTPTTSRDALPSFPGGFEVASALLGVLLLGGVALALFARLRRAPASGDRVLVLRQSLRLSARHRVHAVQLDERILVLGECDAHLTVLAASPNPDAAQDERAIAARADETDAGATPRDLVLTPPAPARDRHPAAVRTRSSALADFRALLRRARTPSGT